MGIEKLGEDARQLTVGGRIDNPGHVIGFQLNTVMNRLFPVQVADIKDTGKGKGKDPYIDQIRKLRTDHPDWSQRKVAREMDVNPSIVNRRWEKVFQ